MIAGWAGLQVKGKMIMVNKKAGLFVLLVAFILPLLSLITPAGHTSTSEAAMATSYYQHGKTFNFEVGLPGLYTLTSREDSESVTTVNITGQLLYHKGQVSLLLPEGTELTIVETTDVEAGAKICTGPAGMAEIRWPDGSTIMIAENTEVTVTEALGFVRQEQNDDKALLHELLPLHGEFSDGDDQAGIEIASLKLKLETGTIYGSLILLSEELKEQKEVLIENPSVRNPEHDHRVIVDMPWGVAGIRGTVWMNKVESGLEVTSVMTGVVLVSAGGDKVSVKPGQFTAVKGSGQKPSLPAKMPFREMKQWQQVSAWVDQVISSERDVQQEVVDQVLNATEKAAQAPGQSGITPGQSGSTPGQSGITPGQSGSTPGQSGITPGQSGSAPGQSGSAPGQSGTTPGQSGATPGQSGTTPGQSGSTPGQSGTTPGQSGSAPGQSGSAPGQSGSAPGNSGNAPGQNK
jgi:hypothetical protein